MAIIERADKTTAPAQCAVCAVSFPSRPGQSRPPLLCAKCSEKWGDKTAEPWLAYLIREERKHRSKKWRETDVGYVEALE